MVDPGLRQTVKLFQWKGKTDPEGEIIAPGCNLREFFDLSFVHHPFSFFRFMVRRGLVRER
jgi:hypothetical protein